MALGLQMNEAGTPAANDRHSPRDATPCGWVVACEIPSAELAGEWDALSAEGVASPYQSRSWVMSFLETAAKAAGQEPAIMTVRGADGALLGLFPLVVKTGRMGRIASFVGDKHANYHLPLLKPEFAATLAPRQCQQLMRAMGQQLPGLDAFVFINQPRRWNGIVPPLVALAAWNGAQPAYALSLLPDGEAAMERAMSTHARKAMRNKRRRLEDMGRITLLKAVTSDEINRVAEAFLEQKAARFADLGIADPFAEEGVMTMLTTAAMPREGAEPSILWHALMLDGRIIASFVGAVDKQRYSGMATSFTADEALAKLSPGEALLAELILDQAQSGRQVFDLGVGEARYKTTFCDLSEAMCETVLPITARGYLVLALLQLRRMAKQAAIVFGRRHPTAFRALRRIARP